MPRASHAAPKTLREPVAQPADLDPVDVAILNELARAGRLPNNRLAERVGVAPSTCLMRVRRLEQVGAITGYRADLAPAVVGRPLQALVAVRLQAHARSGIGALTARYAALPGVLNVFFLAGADDFQLHVAACSPGDLREFVVEHLSASRDVAATQTNLIFEHVSVPPTL